MADRNMTNYGAVAGKPSRPVWPGQVDGKVRVSYDTITTDGTEVVNSKIYCGQLEPYATFLYAQVIWGALGASTTLQLGDDGDDDRYLAATSTAAVGSITAMTSAGMGYRNETTKPIPLFLTVKGATLATGQPIKLAIYTTRE